MVASIPLLKAGYPPAFIGDEQRDEYRDAFEKVALRSAP